MHVRQSPLLLAIVAFVALAATTLLWPRIGPADATGCSPARPHPSGSSTETITPPDGLRSYILHIPPSYTGADAVPLILNFHGLGSDATGQELYSGLSLRADQADGGFIMVYPEGTVTAAQGPRHWNNTQVPAPEPDDVAFVSQLLDVLQSSLCLDAAQLFSTGMSNGAMMSVRLACSLSDRIAAIAPVAGAYYPPLFLDISPNEDCPDTRPVPIVAFHGTADTTVPFNGGPGLGGVLFRLPIDNTTADADVLSEWALHNGCTSGRQETQVTAQVRLVAHQGCDEGASVELYAVDGGGHTWPDATLDIPSLGKTTHEISANDVMWEFFQAHALGGFAPAPTPTPKDLASDTDGDTIANASDPDDDNDGCADLDEEQTAKGSETSGGRRNPHDHWDFFDTPDPNAAPERDKTINLGDIFRVARRFGSNDSGPGDFDRNSDPFLTPNRSITPPNARENYHPAYDRGGQIGANSWNRAPADGSIVLGDIFAVAQQFSHSCA